MARFGDLKHQARWISVVAGSAAGLQFFSVAGPAGTFLSSSIHRIVLNYSAFLAYIWGRVADFFSVELLIYKERLTFAAIILVPYLLRWRRVRPSGLVYDGNKVLSGLNFICFLVVSFHIYKDDQSFTGERWLVWLSISPLAASFLVIGAWFLKKDPDYRTSFKIAMIVISLGILGIAAGVVAIEYEKIGRIFQPVIFLSVLVLSSSAYAIGLVFKVDGYYPFLFVVIVYAVFFSINSLLIFFPLVDEFLTSIGV